MPAIPKMGRVASAIFQPGEWCLYGLSWSGILGYDHRYRLTHVTHFIPGQHRVLRSFDLVKFPFIHADSGGNVLQYPFDVLSGKHRRNARGTASSRGV